MTQPKLNTYLNLCTQVYELSKPNPPEDAYAFYKSYAVNAKGPILEPMCGTGRFLLPLLKEGFALQGFDASEHMLQVLQAKAQQQGLKPNVWQGFVERVETQEKYGLIFIPSGSFGLITTLDAAMAALKKFYDHLNEDGLLVFEAETLNAAPANLGLWKASVWPREDGKLIIANFLDLPLADGVGTTVGKYELVEGNQIIQTEIENYKVRLYDPQHLLEMLERVGFKDIRMVKAFDSTQVPAANDEVFIYECRK